MLWGIAPPPKMFELVTSIGFVSSTQAQLVLIRVRDCTLHELCFHMSLQPHVTAHNSDRAPASTLFRHRIIWWTWWEFNPRYKCMPIISRLLRTYALPSSPFWRVDIFFIFARARPSKFPC